MVAGGCYSSGSTKYIFQNENFSNKMLFLTFAATPYSLLAPRVCICDFLLSAITEFLRTSSARMVSARMVMRRVKIGV